MAVIIDEFEVVPDREDERPPQPRPPAAQPARTDPVELERALRTLRERLDRVKAR